MLLAMVLVEISSQGYHVEKRQRINGYCRFGMLHPNRVHGIVAINTSASTSLGRFTEKLSERMSNIKTDDANRLNKK